MKESDGLDRICPGMWTAEATIFILIAQVLAVFNIEKAGDDCGNVVEPDVEYGTGMIRQASRPILGLSEHPDSDLPSHPSDFF
jgi:hypothetical protein